MEHFDVLIVGAGISGIGAAYHLQTLCPGRTYAVLEGRENIGGTWDLFRYPGIRSDSDMYTLGYRFKPWKEQKAIADGPDILKYLKETAEENGIDRHIRFSHHVTSAAWSSETDTWTVEARDEASGETRVFSAGFLFMCTGYYDYEEGYTPDFPGIDRFEGRVVHPQKWTEDIDYEGKRVVVIGSGATAVTLVPALAEKAAHVTMLQRTPSYVVTVPGEDPVAKLLRRRLPPKAHYRVMRWKNVLVSLGLYTASRKAPKKMRALFKKGVQNELGEDYDVDTHFDPPYDPWDQRLCLVPDSDLFRAIKSERATVVTDHIETFTERGLKLRSGEELEADIIVTATGLKLCFMSNIALRVDGREVEPSELWTYKAMMFSDVPNLALWFGYTNASWTLKADLTSEYVCRLLNHMKAKGYSRFVPRAHDPTLEERPFVDLASGYIERAQGMLPKQGSKRPWRLHMNYILDVLSIRYSNVDDPAMEFR
ncbi:MAG: NAD(P)/FAD-dependent oxidoreductase [Myxococcota bacterium]|nr:NAD(P)/FAD-dependent oxidoreductase [Myxococcota bacterium]